MNFEEAAKELGISEEELEKLVASGDIASTKDGDNLLFKKEAIESYKNQGDAEIVLADDELNLLDDDDEIDFGIDLSDGDDAATEDLGELEISLDDDAGGSVGDETVLDVESLLDDDDGDSEGTTPIPGAEDSSSADTDLGDETLLDTDILDLGDDDADTFELDTTEDTLLDPTEEGTLLRGGGARVMQMKKRKSHAAWTVLLSFAALALLVPMAVLLAIIYNENLTNDRGEYYEANKVHSQAWIKDYAGKSGKEGVRKAVHGIADMFV
ncbi:MAG: helix-turn-helix domain-containing protein, partial [Planctomycetota bacterium]|nr:helix-turn-helix domain-containing protein [Planctomycetota bacterium]